MLVASGSQQPVFEGGNVASCLGDRDSTTCGQYISSKRETGGDWTPDGRPQGPTTPHPLPARPYYTTKWLARPVYSRGRGGCGRGDGALVAARPCFEMYCPLWGPCLGGRY